MFFMFMPLEEHYDDGFGAVGDAFKLAADALEKQITGRPTAFWQHLPLNFLRRHACELYLKSEIVILHRWLNLAYGEADPHGQPFVKTPKGWKPLYQVHSISTLYQYWRYLFDGSNTVLTDITKLNWSLPNEIGNWVSTIDKSDPQSTLFRYPTTKSTDSDRAKDSYKPMDIDNLIPSSGKPQTGGFLTIDEEGDMKAFNMDENAVKDVSDALQQLVELLFRWHHQLRSKITQGY